MKNNLEGKKLLILGANPETSPLVECANKMGIKTLVTSNNPEDDAKKYAWKSCHVDGTDVQGIVTLAQQEKVDGILVGVADVLVPAYSKACEELGLSCYATEKIVQVFSYKDVFKRTCEQYGIHGIPEYSLSAELKECDIAKINFPVMVKPVDNCSGKGMTICYDREELKPAIEKALAASRKKRFIVERYMTCDDIFVYYTFKDGACELSAIADRFTTKKQGKASPVCVGARYPSKYRELYYKTMHENACRMFRDIGIKNGVLLIQGFVDQGQIYVYDPGFRLQGEAPHLLIDAVNGFDQREMLIEFALTGSMGNAAFEAKNDSNFGGKTAGSLWLLLKKGKIKRIEGIEQLKEDKCVVHIVQRFHEGDEVTDSMVGSENQVLARIYIVCDSEELYRKKINEIEALIHVIDTDGNNMLVELLDADKYLA